MEIYTFVNPMWFGGFCRRHHFVSGKINLKSQPQSPSHMQFLAVWADFSPIKGRPAWSKNEYLFIKFYPGSAFINY
jgi:hypothetical protein